MSKIRWREYISTSFGDTESIRFYCPYGLKDEIYLYEENLCLYTMIKPGEDSIFFNSEFFKYSFTKTNIKNLYSMVVKTIGCQYRNLINYWKPDIDMFFTRYYFEIDSTDCARLIPFENNISAKIDTKQNILLYRYDNALLTSKNIKFFYKENKTKPRNILTRQYVYQKLAIDFYIKINDKDIDIDIDAHT